MRAAGFGLLFPPQHPPAVRCRAGPALSCPRNRSWRNQRQVVWQRASAGFSIVGSFGRFTASGKTRILLGSKQPWSQSNQAEAI